MRAQRSWLATLLGVALVGASCGTHAGPPPEPSASGAVPWLCGALPKTPNVILATDLSDRCPALGARGIPHASAKDSPKQGSHEADGYRVLIAPGNELTEWVRAGQYEFAPPADVRIEVDAGMVSGSTKDRFGLMCRFNMGLTPGHPDPTMYSFIVGGDGAYLIQYLEGQAANPRDVILASGVGPVPRAGLNHFRVDCVGRTLTLFLNSQKVVTVEDDRLPAGLSGIRAESYNDQLATEFIFRNLVVSKA